MSLRLSSRRLSISKNRWFSSPEKLEAYVAVRIARQLQDLGHRFLGSSALNGATSPGSVTVLVDHRQPVTVGRHHHQAVVLQQQQGAIQREPRLLG